MKRLPLKGLLLGLAIAATITNAQAFPDRVVRLIVPFAPGGVTDLAARLIGQKLSVKWGQQVVIENRPGAGGVIGVEAAIHSTPDGYTLLMATNGEITINAAIFTKPKYDAQKDLLPIATVTSTPFVWSANLNAGIDSLAGLVSAAKAKPGALASERQCASGKIGNGRRGRDFHALSGRKCGSARAPYSSRPSGAQTASSGLRSAAIPQTHSIKAATIMRLEPNR